MLKIWNIHYQLSSQMALEETYLEIEDDSLYHCFESKRLDRFLAKQM